MAEIKLGGGTANTLGELPAPGDDAPDFTLVKSDLSPVSLSDFAGQRLVLNIFPSIDTPTCAASVRRFNAECSSLENATVLNVSMDLPFAQGRFCGAEGLDKVQNASDFRDQSFGKTYGVRFVDGPLTGLFARAVVVVDEKGKVIHSQYVPVLSDEPDYDAALDAVNAR
jgi:thiol peroxidase